MIQSAGRIVIHLQSHPTFDCRALESRVVLERLSDSGVGGLSDDVITL